MAQKNGGPELAELAVELQGEHNHKERWEDGRRPAAARRQSQRAELCSRNSDIGLASTGPRRGQTTVGGSQVVPSNSTHVLSLTSSRSV